MLDKQTGDSLRSRFVAAVATHTERPALAVRGATLTYSDLDRNARKYAACIYACADSPIERVGIFAYRSEVSYVGTVAALMAGATFVPLNPTFPPERTSAMIERADLDAIIVDKACFAQLGAIGPVAKSIPLLLPELEAPSLPVWTGPIFDAKAIASATPLQQLRPIIPTDTAYLLFTSGSTGAPKGVPVTHGNVCHFIDVMNARYRIQPDDRFSQTFDQTFDLSVFDMFMAWLHGACLVSMASVELLAPTGFIQRNGITVWFSVPSVPIQMLRRETLRPNSLGGLRLSLFCGEPLEARVAEAWQAAAPNSYVENLYGPTELTIACFVHRWSPSSSPSLCRHGLVPIGRPYEGLCVEVCDERLQPASYLEPGELCVSGPQTSPGYWNDATLTAQKFVELPVNRMEKRRFYRTGDRVQQLESGDYVFLGRIDHQIKVLGHRVELGEIEAALRAVPGVDHAVAFGWPIDTFNAQHIVAVIAGRDLDGGALTKVAQKTLPPYMVPQRLLFKADMPLNANGKIDRKALQQELLNWPE